MFGQTTAEAFGDWRRIDDLREAIQANRVSFPTPVPIFPTQFRPDIQWRLVELYFVRGWTSKDLSERYGVTARRIQQSLQHWVNRAIERGYLQAIPPESVLTSLPTVSSRAAASGLAVPLSPQFVPIPAVAAPLVAEFQRA